VEQKRRIKLWWTTM